MRIVHVAPFAPGRCGLYETTAELIMAERKLGHDVELIDAGISGEGRKIGVLDPQHGVRSRGFSAATGADLIVSHTSMPKQVLALTDAPIVHCLHGRPEGSFRLSQTGKQPVYDLITQWAKDPRYVGFITFWPEYLPYWQTLVPEAKLHALQVPCVDLARFKPTGEPHTFAPSGSPNILIAGTWREDTTPYHALHALTRPDVRAAAPGMKVHVYGLDSPLGPLKHVFRRHAELGIAGERRGMMRGLSLVLRSADIVVTAHRIATRIVREALASGTPVIAGHGNPWTPYRCDWADPTELAHTLERIQLDRGTSEEARYLAQKFDHLEVGARFLDLCGSLMPCEAMSRSSL